MKTTKLITPTLVLVLFFALTARAQVNAGDLLPRKPVNWTEKQLLQPAQLAATLSDAKAKKPLIFNMGPVEDIPGAIRLGAASDDANVAKLKERLKNVPKDTEIVVYCGCCPFDRCPNIRPAYQAMINGGFVNAKVLNLSTNIKTDWIGKGYPYVN